MRRRPGRAGTANRPSCAHRSAVRVAQERTDATGPPVSVFRRPARAAAQVGHEGLHLWIVGRYRGEPLRGRERLLPIAPLRVEDGERIDDLTVASVERLGALKRRFRFGDAPELL